MGSLNKINDLPENFLIMNGDILTDLILQRILLDNHTKNKSLFMVQKKDYNQLIMVLIRIKSKRIHLQSFFS